MPKDYDFAGWVTKNDTLCCDGVVIKHDAFAGNDNGKVPLVWEHVHSDPTNVLGYVMLHNADKGVYGYGYFNDTEEAAHAKTLLEHGDISSMSIAANKIQKHGQDVVHGRIFEVSLVLAGANPGAMIEDVVTHGDTGDGSEAVIYTGNLLHSADDIIDDKKEEKQVDDDKKTTDQQPTDQEGDKTVEEVLKTLTPEQEAAVAELLAAVAGDQEDDGNEDADTQDKNKEPGDDQMKHNVFEAEKDDKEILTHSQEAELIADAKSVGSLKEAYLQHGITNIETLFPEYQNLQNEPVIYRDTNTNSDVIVNGATKSPFSRVKTVYADFTEDEARARGYIKGNQKLEQVYTIMHRTTDPQTIYKKQKLDRDDVIDIKDMDIVAFTNKEMRFMLNEEIARAILVGDGRAASDASKIQETHIRPIISDDDMYTIKKTFASAADLIEVIIKALAEYRGSGKPTLYIDPVLLAEFRLLKANDGRYLFGDVPSVESMAARLGVAAIVDTTFMAGKGALLANLSDYTIGATKGGEVTTFDDFDIDFNQYKYLIETRLSGALTMPKSAIYLTQATPAGGTSTTPASAAPKA